MQNFPGIVTNTRIPNCIWHKPYFWPTPLFAQILPNMQHYPDHWYRYNMNDNPKYNILVLENVRQ